MWSFADEHNMVSSANLGFGEETYIPELLWKPEAMEVWLSMNKNTTQLASNKESTAQLFSLQCPKMAYAKDNLPNKN